MSRDIVFWKTIAIVSVIGMVVIAIYAFCIICNKSDHFVNEHREWYLHRGDVEIFVQEYGSGTDTVIVIHGGFGANHDYMIDAVRGLERQFHFVFYDQRGSLLSPTAKENLTFQKNIDDLYGLIRALGLDSVKLLGHSMGSLVAMEFTEQHPDLVSHIVLVGAIAPKLDNEYFLRIHNSNSFLSSRQAVLDLRKPYEEKGILNVLSGQQRIRDSEFTHKDLTEYWRIGFAATNIYDMSKVHKVRGGRAYFKPEAAVMQNTVNWDFDYREILNSKNTTIINGEYDFLDLYSEHLKAILVEYPNINLIIMPKAGHNPWIDNPDLFRKHLQNALK